MLFRHRTIMSDSASPGSLSVVVGRVSDPAVWASAQTLEFIRFELIVRGRHVIEGARPCPDSFADSMDRAFSPLEMVLIANPDQ